jgi:GPN-loop GTPase
VNLDPAAEAFEYEVAFDVRDLITLSDVMEELELGPNGGLVRALLSVFLACSVY